jgi:hypothetical protein
MRGLFAVGLILLIIGLGLFFVPLPQRERHGVEIGDAQVGIETESRRKVSPYVSGLLVVVGAGLMIAGGRRRV